MALKDALLPEFDREMESTRKTLERVPEDKFDWKPHEKSMAMGRLASHIANLFCWVSVALQTDSADIAPAGEPPRKDPKTTAELVETFDRNVASARAALAEASDETLRAPWTMIAGGRTIFTAPRVAALRTFVMNHSIHHRAQLGVYLRLNDIPVPSVYGPSADES